MGDAVKLGLLTEAIGAGRKAAEAIDALLKGRELSLDTLPPIPTARIKLEYYDPRVKGLRRRGRLRRRVRLLRLLPGLLGLRDDLPAERHLAQRPGQRRL